MTHGFIDPHLKAQLWRCAGGLVSSASSIVISEMSHIEQIVRIIASGAGALASLFFIASVIKHWNDKR
jgi:hypothetical protein